MGPVSDLTATALAPHNHTQPTTSSVSQSTEAQNLVEQQAAAQPQLSQSQRVESKEGNGTVRADGTGEGNAIANSGAGSTGTSIAVANGDGQAVSVVAPNAGGNAHSQTEGLGKSEAIAFGSGNAAAISRAEGDTLAHAGEGNAMVVSNSVGEATAHVPTGDGNAVAIAEDAGNVHAHSLRGGNAVAVSRGAGNVEAKIGDGEGEAGNVAAFGLGMGETNALQNGKGFFALFNASGNDVNVSNHFDGTVRFDMTEDGIIQVTLNGQPRVFIPEGGENFVIDAAGNLSGALPVGG